MKKLLLILLMGISTSSVFGQVEALIGEVRLFAGNFAPQGWAFCEGQTMSIQQYTALFSLLGVQYGGDGRTNFNLPDLRGRVPVGVGQLSGTNLYIQQGQVTGSPSVTILNSNLPNTFSRVEVVKPSNGDSTVVVGQIEPSANTPISTYPPSLGLRYIICLQGLYPSRP